MMAADKARQMEEDRENNVVELPSEEEFSADLENKA